MIKAKSQKVFGANFNVSRSYWRNKTGREGEEGVEAFCPPIIPPSILNILNRVKKETLARIFSSKFCEIFKNTFFYQTPPVPDSI